MQVRKQFWFDCPADLMERVLDGGISLSPTTRLELVEGGVREHRVVVDAPEVEGIRRAA